MKRQARSTGFTIVELLMALSIAAVLLAAIAASVHATLMSYDENEKVSLATQAGRWALQRMMSDVRTAAAVDVYSGSMTIVPAENRGIDQIEYYYTNGILYYKQTVGTETTVEPIVGDREVKLTAFTLNAQMGTNQEGLSCTARVKARLTFTVGDETLSMTASSAPRRNLDL